MFAFQHSCGCSQLGDDLENTQKLLRGLLLHPNAGGVLALCLFDAGRLLSGSPREELTREPADLVLAVASGRQRAKTESFDKSEITIFRDGVTL